MGRLILSPSKRGNSTKNENLPQPALLIHRWISRKEERGVKEGVELKSGKRSPVPQMPSDVLTCPSDVSRCPIRPLCQIWALGLTMDSSQKLQENALG